MLSLEKKVGVGLLVITLVFFSYFTIANFFAADDTEKAGEVNVGFAVNPIEHASFAMKMEGVNVLNNPVGEIDSYSRYLNPDLILVSSASPTNLDIALLSKLVSTSTVILAPAAVVKMLTPDLAKQTVTMGNGDRHNVFGMEIEAIPMYNLIDSGADYINKRGVGNGYLLTKNGFKVYIAGDTEDTSEMRALENIDVAFIPMSLPDTMDTDVAADAVLDFAPKKVYPYHYLGKDGLADTEEFARLVHEGNSVIEVVELDWYPRQ